MLNIKIFPKLIYDYIFLSISIGAALLTFARGGVIAPIVAICFLFCYKRCWNIKFSTKEFSM
ncbi:hypothetical protein CM15mP43_12740 [bacterium]|nr:MAG: hypothetical protein CM15mP43_12740 [bacterium]